MPVEKPIIAVTMGDPSGIGPEIIAKCLVKKAARGCCAPFVVGDANTLAMALELAGSKSTGVLKRLKSFDEFKPGMEGIQVLDLANVNSAGFRWGTVRAEYGRAAGAYIEKAAELALAGKARAIVTAPIQKEAFHAAGYPYPGHTEMLADLTKQEHFALMLAIGNFRVVHVSQHLALREAVRLVTAGRVYETIRVAHGGCAALGIERPRIGVAGLNPHAGEGGLFGAEEQTEIIPAIERARREGIAAEGPFSPDTVFSLLKGGRFDVVVCMYHDQGGIPMKLLAFDWDAARGTWPRVRGVNVTLGLPIIRTSVSHGTGFDIAGKNLADPSSLEEAITLAARMARTAPRGGPAMRGGRLIKS